ncbi:MAG TPA: 50S ribosomal protein L17 [Myxococcota bacterium]|nr:50S ribosomal protein L17 [Myxococcota bacterium]
MRHRNAGRKLGRTSSHRRAMLRNLVTSLLEHEQIETTDAKAKELRRVAERMITLGKRGSLHARRQALRVVRSRAVAAKLFEELAERYRTRPGGYTRVLKLRTRVGDAAPVSMIELVDRTALPAKAAEAAKTAKERSERARGEEKPAGRRARAEKPTRAEKPAKGKAREPKPTRKTKSSKGT